MVMRAREPFTSRTSLGIQLPAQKALTVFWPMPRLRAAAQELFLLAIRGPHSWHQWGQSSRKGHLHVPSQGTVHRPGLRRGILGTGALLLFSVLCLQQRCKITPSGLRLWETERLPRSKGSLVPTLPLVCAAGSWEAVGA